MQVTAYKLQQLIFLGLRKGSFVNLFLREFCAVVGGVHYARKRGSAESKKAKATCVGGLHDSLQSPPHCHAKPHGWRQLSCFLIQISETRCCFLSNSQFRFLWAQFHLYRRRDVTHLSLPWLVVGSSTRLFLFELGFGLALIIYLQPKIKCIIAGLCWRPIPNSQIPILFRFQVVNSAVESS